ncbi:non-ribosomal peptide synthetase [Pseudoalteromonas luteoviolacea]|uniref:Carrier domain-containing protein n=1 Tax=Pseudoalteromonas luteoviolacea DSM 6061 TaxID=1365250 RepID=A0A166XM95_9GAMM|nr:non-ribosomal peptide synthetase [Pseudoalteromonas luteoviolacea]KZN40562.1 hypothetical protein N475_11460 [Pseudoalteromonas luteoviolacea DSM 6061]MBE0389655.1 arthrofactin-type cyclic lipopeptide synthetase C [Pseudoalteromonas luteoviolacea DSM 6061]
MRAGNYFIKGNVDTLLGLTPAQEGILYEYVTAQDSCMYCAQLHLTLSGPISINDFQRAIKVLVDGNETLRSVFRWKQVKKPVQIVLKSVADPFTYIDYTQVSTFCSSTAYSDALAYIEADRKNTFDLEQGAFRVALLKTDHEQYQLVITNHHIILDGWSNSVLLKELFSLYRYIKSRQHYPHITKPSLEQFRKHQLAELKKNTDSQFWLNYLNGITPSNCFPIKKAPENHVTSSNQEPALQKVHLTLNKSAVDQFARAHGLTVSTLMYGIWGLLLRSYYNTDDIRFGTAISHRPPTLQSAAEVVGIAIQTLPIRFNYGENISLKEYFSAVQCNLNQCFNHPNVSLANLIGDSDINHQSELFDTLFVVENYPLPKDEILAQTGLTLDSYSSWEQNNYPMSVCVQLFNEYIVEFNYAGSDFESALVRQLIQHFEHLLRLVLANVDMPIQSVSLMSAEQRKDLLEATNESYQKYAYERPVIEVFESQVTSNPHLVALKYGEQHIDYATLNNRANQLAALLQTQFSAAVQVKNKPYIVAVLMEPSLNLFVSMLAIMKLGATYLPIDTSTPNQRILTILAESGSDLLLGNSKHFSEFENCVTPIIALDQLAFDPTQVVCNPSRAIAHSDLLYVIYTSGSSGVPKGVMISQGAFSTFYQAYTELLEIEPSDSVLSLTGVAFDIFFGETLVPLLNGAQVIIAGKENAREGKEIVGLLNSQDITLFQATPTRLSMMLVETESKNPHQNLQKLVLAGEPLPLETYRQAREYFGPNCQILNLYGPTEATIYATVDLMEEVEHVVIGKALSNSKAYVLDRHGHVQPPMIPGEICLGGDALASGYLNNSTLTEQFFVKPDFVDEPKVYLTRDAARVLPNGVIDILGRLDDQVKIRGFRVELSEIESQLSTNSAVKACLLIVQPDSRGGKYLVAYVIPQEGSNISHLDDRLKDYLLCSLPEYMVPRTFVFITEWPLTANGKVDKKALPLPAKVQLQKEYIEPSTETEQVLLESWAEVLALEKSEISVTSSFFELHGHSLSAVRLVADVRKRLGFELQVKDIFELETIKAIGAKINDGANDKPSERPAVSAVNRDNQDLPLSFAQQRLWFLNQLGDDHGQYNMSVAFILDGKFDVDVAEQAMVRIINRHESLRTIFSVKNNQCVQAIRPAKGFSIDRYDLRSYDSVLQQQKANELIKQDSQKPFDLSQDLMVRAAYVMLSGQNRLLFSVHHIASDGWSIGLLLKEFVTAYQDISQDRPDSLPDLDIQYGDYAYWQRQWLAEEVLEKQLEYWSEQLAEMPAVHNLPLDHDRPAIKTHNGDKLSSVIDLQTMNRLLKVAQQSSMTPFMLLHGALALVLSRHSNSSDIVIGTPVANRNQAELASLIGFFVNTIVLRVDTNHMTLAQYLAHVRDVNLAAQSHQDVPFEQLVDYCKVPRSTQHSPLFQITFTVEDEDLADLALQGVKFIPIEGGSVTAKFDLDISAKLTGQGIEFSWVYDKALFSRETINTMSGHLKLLLRDIAQRFSTTAGCTKLASLAMLSSKQSDYLVNQLNQTVSAYPRDRLLHEVFEAQVQLTPNALAVVSATPDAAQLSYNELNQAANQLANYLREQGVKPQMTVGVCFERCTDMLVAIMAILKAGGAYVALDTAYPEARLQHMLDDAQVGHVVTHLSLLPVFERIPKVQLMALDSMHATLADYSTNNLTRLPGQDISNIAYVIYTSGSTGRPKGVACYGHSVLNLLTHIESLAPLSQPANGLLWTSLSFDVSVYELMSCLLFGHTLHVIDDDIRLDSTALFEYMQAQQISSAYLPPFVIKDFVAWGQTGRSKASVLRRLLVGVEPILLSDLHSIHNNIPGINIINGYGPSEATICSSLYKVDVTEAHSSDMFAPIGKPVNNSQLLILDQHKNLVPFGATGELYIGGDGLAQGYLNQPQLTAKRFIDNPYGEGRLYQTGDFVRYLPDGHISFVGRADNQVKIRGFRIELGEIENRLATCEEVNACLVLALPDVSGFKRLVAYVVPALGVDESNLVSRLKANLQSTLAEYMMPSAFVLLADFPQTVNGKIDKNALPQPDMTSLQGEYCAPSTDVERTLVKILAGLLELDVNVLSVTSNFFELGGHSLLAVQMVAKVRAELSCEIAVNVIFEHPTIKSLALYIEQSAGVSEQSTLLAIPRQPDQKMETSFAQQRLWFVDKLAGGSTEYNMPIVLKVSGAFEPQAAEQAIGRILARHEILRTVLVEGVNGPLQKVQSDVQFNLGIYDLTAFSSEKADKKACDIILADNRKAFDLCQDLMVRAAYVKLPEEKGMLVLNMHHIAADGWSMKILVEEFVIQYQAVLAGQADPLPPLAIQYADYARWQANEMAGSQFAGQLNYWSKQLDGIPSVHTFPLDYPRPQTKQFIGKVHYGTIDKIVGKRLQQLAVAHQATPFMVLHSALALVLSRHSNSQDIVIGTPVANRLRAELAPLIGCFINSLVLRTSTEHHRFRDYLAHVKQVNLDAQANQDVPFEQLVEHCNTPRSSAHTPLFQIMFDMNTNEVVPLSLPDVSFSLMANTETVAKFDLQLSAQIVADEIQLLWTYDTALLSAEYVEQLNSHLVCVVKAISQLSQGGDIDLANLPMLSATEQQYLLSDCNETEVAYNQETLAHKLFEAEVARNPNAVAVLFDEGYGAQQLSYIELDKKANCLAHYLIELGVKPDSLVGICVERSLESMVALLAIHKAGGAYVPFDPDYPASRLDYMLEDSKVDIVLTQSHLQARFNHKNVQCLTIDTIEETVVEYSADAPVVDELTPNSLAYMIYTSGSTGQPKGAQVRHRNMINLLHWYSETYAFDLQSRTLIISSMAFDLTQKNLFTPLISGGSVCLAPAGHYDAVLYRKIIKQNQISHINCAPSAAYGLSDDGTSWDEFGTSLKYILLGGEPIESAWVQQWADYQGQKPALINMYGPTECTDIACQFELTESYWAEHRSTPIGKPNANVRLYVLDRQQSLVPKGSIGELCIAGLGVGAGYLGKVELSAEKFITRSIGDDAKQELLYRTGDLVRYQDDGQLLFVGRIDDQVKIRGFRVELGEIEHHLSSCDGVAASIVLVREDSLNHQNLVGYIEVEDEVDQDSVVAKAKQALKGSLPDYMVPSAFVVVEQWPLTPNGKINKKALPAPDDYTVSAQVIKPQTETEQALVDIWSELLKLPSERISTIDSFFELGGHSLLAVNMVAKIRSQLGQELPVKVIFDTPDIRQVAAVIDAGIPVPLRPEVTAVTRDNEAHPVSFAQQRLWFIDQMANGSNEYNMPVVLRVEGEFNLVVAEQAIGRIIARHEVLRTVYVEGDDGPQQKIRPAGEFSLSFYDLATMHGVDTEAEAAEIIHADNERIFDLSEDLMLRASYLRLTTQGENNQSQKGILVFNMHHIASDGWSMGVLVKEFTALYPVILSGEADPLRPLQIQYTDYAYWQRIWMQSDALAQQLEYWRAQLVDLPVVHSLPLDYARPQVKSHKAKVVNGHLDVTFTERLQQLAKRKNVTLFMLLHSALGIVLSRHSNSNDIVVGTPVANRMQQELAPLIGCFINTLVLRTQCGQSESQFTFDDYLSHVKQVNLEAQANQDVMFEQLVEHCKAPRSTAHTPLFQIMLNMDTTEAMPLAIPGLTITPQATEVVAKFDMNVTVRVTAHGIELDWIYDTALFNHGTVEILKDHFERILTSIGEDSERAISDLEMLSAEQINHLVKDLNQTKLEYPVNSSIHQLFEAQAQRIPNTTALLFEEQSLTFSQLNQQANQVAHCLKAQGVGKGTLVGICVERSMSMVVGILAILKAGGAYVPLDPAYPRSRLAYIIQDSSLMHILTESGQLGELGLSDDIVLTDLAADKSEYPVTNPEHDTAGLAYVIYTSGSTGQPKGVLVEHTNVVAFYASFSEQLEALGVSDKSPWAWTSSFAFDASVKGLVYLLMGRPVIIASAMQSKDPEAIVAMIEQHNIEVYNANPFMLDMVIDQLQSTEKCYPHLISSGEQISAPIFSKLQMYSKLNQCRVINAYGPTETTINSTFGLLGDTLHIGRPIANTQAYVLDAQQNLQPKGCVGELCLGGAGVTPGYLNRPQLTDEKFIKNPFGGGRLYRTGDLVRYDEDGNLIFVGRMDEQVKIRGFRIEPGEITHRLGACKGVDSALVLVREDEHGEKRLVAYVLGQQEIGNELIADIKHQLQGQLPDYMIPSAFVMVEKWPLTGAGKIDKSALPGVDDQTCMVEYVAPSTDTERMLLAIWADLLKVDVEKISVTENFFDIGGHSLLLVRLLSAIRQQTNVKLDIQQTYLNPTIHSMAKLVEYCQSSSSLTSLIDNADDADIERMEF